MENKKGFAMNHHAIALDPNLSFRDYWVYGALQSFRNGETGRCNPSNRALIVKTKGKIGLTCLYESIVRLEKSGWITVVRRMGYTNRFTFPYVPLRSTEGGHSAGRRPPHRSSEYKQEVVNKKDYEQERSVEKFSERRSDKTPKELMLDGLNAKKRKELLEKMSMNKGSTPIDFDEYGQTALREDATGLD